MSCARAVAGGCCLLPIGLFAAAIAFLAVLAGLKPVTDVLGPYTTPVLGLTTLAGVLLIVHLMNRGKEHRDTEGT